MFYRPDDRPAVLTHNPFKAIVAPRPIGWISTRDGEGRNNLAPYSFFNAVSDAPPIVMFASTGAKPDRAGTKDSMAALEQTGVFAVNIVSEALRDPMNASSAPLPAGEDEFAAAGLTAAPCEVIDCPRVAEAPASFECRVWKVLTLPGESNRVAFGEVVGVHIDPAFIVDGRFDVTRVRPLSRLGYRDYATVTEVFSLNRPSD